MNLSSRTVGAIAGIILVIGAGWIVYSGRPVMQQPQTTPAVAEPVVNTPPVQEPTPTPTTTATAPAPVATPTPEPSTPTPAPTPAAPAPGTYTMEDVAKHAVESDCWSVVNGQVYDLTSWVSRHPGGSRAIVGMCGKDASASFERKHGGAPRPQAALVLLKIGTLR